MAENKDDKSLLNVARFSFKKQQDRVNSEDIKKLRKELFVSEDHTLDFNAELLKELNTIEDLNLLVNLRNFFKFECDMLEKGLHQKISGEKVMAFFQQLDERYKFSEFKDSLSFNWELKDEKTGQVHKLDSIKEIDPANITESIEGNDNMFSEKAPAKDEGINYSSHKKKGWKKSA